MPEFTISLKAARNNAGLTQKELAEKLHVNRATVNNWETGKSKPDFAALTLIADICKIPIDLISLP